MTFDEIKTHFDKLLHSEPDSLLAISNTGLQNACKGALSKACGGDDNRKLITIALIGKSTSKDFTLNEWYALFRFVFPTDAHGLFVFKNPVTNKWEGRPELQAWCGAIFTHLSDQAGQTKMFDEPQRTAEEIKEEMGFTE